MDKPTKPNVDLPNSFGGVKNNFSASKILNGYEKDVPDIFGGANINYMLDTLGKRQMYYDTIVDYINGLPIGKTITTDSNNKLVYEDLRTDFSGLATVDLDNLTTTGENHFANKDLSNLTTSGEKHFLNHSQITNCILEAPNGVANCINNYSTFIVYSGLKILIANGRNADGTMNNIEYTVPSDLTYNVVYGFQSGMIVIDNAGHMGTIANAKYIIDIVQPTNPATNDIWYSPTTNLIKLYNGTQWVQTYHIPVAYFSTSTNPNALLWFKSLRAIRIYTHNDDSELSGISFPSVLRRVHLTLQASRSLYTAPSNGWVFVNGTAAASGIPYVYIYDEAEGLGISATGTQGVAQAVYMPVRKGQKFMVIYGNVTITYIGFAFAEGEI